MMKTCLSRMMLLSAALLVAGPALAHGSMKPLHGGQVALAGETVVELVRAPRGVTVYLSDEDQPVAAAGMTGKLIITRASKKEEVALKAGAGNRMEAAGLKIAKGEKVTVSLTEKATQARGMVSFTAN